MELFNLLNTPFLDTVVESVKSIDLNFIGQFIKILIEGIGITGVGIIVFTLILKTIVMPLDIYSRIKTKKQALVMEQMRPQMEKLQKQYANDKNMYNQKVLELQKKSGYSPFAACLPMIISLVIFIVVFNAFSTYSQHANVESYNGMVKAYNASVYSYVIDKDSDENAFLYAYNKVDNNATNYSADANFDVQTTDSVKGYTVGDKLVFLVNYDKFEEYYKAHPIEVGIAVSGLEENVKNVHSFFLTATDNEKNQLVYNYIQYFAAIDASEYYKENNNSFLWVRNIWYPDSMLNKEVPDFNGFKSAVAKADLDGYEQYYNMVTANLGTQKTTYNGYFVLIVIAIGGMLLQQWITMRSQKAMNDLGTVDGRANQTNKMMMIMMPIMYGIFSFFYSASFSIYMITNTFYSIITTLIINKVIDVRFAKNLEKAAIQRKTRVTPTKRK